MAKISRCRAERQNPNARNFGLGSKDILSAARNALVEQRESKVIGFQTVRNHHANFSRFINTMKSEFNINLKDFRKIEYEHVQQYAVHLVDRVSNESLSTASAHQYLSSVNRVIEHARGDKNCTINPVKDAGLPVRTGVCRESQYVSASRHAEIKTQLPERAGSLVSLQRELGFRFQESAKFDAVKNQHIQVGQTLRISAGTKGGRDREILIRTESQTDAIKHAANIQQNDRSMIPGEMSYKDFRNDCYRQFSTIPAWHCHAERHSYAHNLYQKLYTEKTGITGISSPVEAGIKHGTEHHQYLAEKLNLTVNEAKSLDNEIRLQVSIELGHSRISIANNYLG
ncbi:integrase domain-containing protein [Photobacterium sp. ZSDE20]|nr:integrase domain-containing protein [Photobacterium sp. ZSDE20]